MKKSLFRKDWVPAVLAVVGFYLLLAAVGIGCPIKFVTGISCAGCGMTRAWLALLRLDVRTAFAYHPLFWLPPVALIIFAMKRKIPQKMYKLLLFTIVLLFGIVYMYRMIGDDQIVIFEPKKGIFFRIAEFIYNRRR